MSNFETFARVSAGNVGTAPNIFVGSTVDSLATITTAGYMNDKAAVIKPGDVIYINYLDASVYPLNTGQSSTLGEFEVSYSAPNWTIASVLTGLGQAAAKAVTDNTKSYVASVDGAPASYTVGNFLVAGDINGSIGADSGIGSINVLQYAKVSITAAQFNGMYAAPVLLVAAPGANKLISIQRMDLVMTFVSADYAAGGVVAAQYDSTAHGAGVNASTSEAAADFFAAASTTFQFGGISGNTVGALPFSTTVNKGIYLSNLTQAFTTGDSTWVAHVFYHVIPTV